MRDKTTEMMTKTKPRIQRSHHKRRPRGGVATACKEDHPPWVCQAFKRVSVSERRELIPKSGDVFDAWHWAIKVNVATAQENVELMVVPAIVTADIFLRMTNDVLTNPRSHHETTVTTTTLQHLPIISLKKESERPHT